MCWKLSSLLAQKAKDICISWNHSLTKKWSTSWERRQRWLRSIRRQKYFWTARACLSCFPLPRRSKNAQNREYTKKIKSWNALFSMSSASNWSYSSSTSTTPSLITNPSSGYPGLKQCIQKKFGKKLKITSKICYKELLSKWRSMGLKHIMRSSIFMGKYSGFIMERTWRKNLFEMAMPSFPKTANNT